MQPIAERLRRDLQWRRHNNQHAILGIQGDPGSGKSTLGLGIGLGLDPGFGVGNVHYNRDDWREIVSAPKGGIFLLDEGNNVASNRTWQNREQVALMQILNMIRQRNHILIWATPSLERLDVIIRQDLVTHRINCVWGHWYAKVRTKHVDRDGEPAGWQSWKGKLRWPNLTKHPIWNHYEAAKEANFLRKAQEVSTTSHLQNPFTNDFGNLEQPHLQT